MSGKYSEGKYEHTFTQQEVDAMIAATLEKAAAHNPFVAVESRHGVDHRVWIYCSCGFNKDGKHLDGDPWSTHILTLADQNALAEHDAALRHEIESLRVERDVAVGQAHQWDYWPNKANERMIYFANKFQT